MAEFKPNTSPIIYWGLAYGLAAGFLLLIMSLLSRYITFVWPFVFMAGLVWGGYRNYRKQKTALGIAPASSPLQEFRQAVQDIASVSQEVFNQDEPQAESLDQAPQQEVSPEVEEQLAPPTEEVIVEENPPAPPYPPQNTPTP